MDTINIENVSRYYNDMLGQKFVALDDVSLTWKNGESIAIMGESGCGKSTLAKILIGLENPSSGTVRFDNENTRLLSYRKWREYRADLQAVFQDSSGTLNPTRSTYANAEEALVNLTKLNKQQRKEKIFSLMSFMGLDKKLLDIPVKRLSGGEQRRIGLLRSLAVCPKFLILDEITAGLDIISTETIINLLKTYQNKYKCNYLVITHNINVAKSLCSKIIEISNGKIVCELIKRKNI